MSHDARKPVRPGLTQTKLYKHRRFVDAGNFGFKKKRNCTIRVAKTTVLKSFAVTAKLICAFVFAFNSKIQFSRDAAHIILTINLRHQLTPILDCFAQTNANESILKQLKLK